MTDETNRPKTNTPGVDRRCFIGSAAATAGLMIVNPSLVRGASANSDVRVGLLGCGGRGTEDASNLVDTGSARVVALADLFPDQLETARKHFDEIQQAKELSCPRYKTTLRRAGCLSQNSRVQRNRRRRYRNASLLSPDAS